MRENIGQSVMSNLTSDNQKEDWPKSDAQNSELVAIAEKHEDLEHEDDEAQVSILQ